MLKLINLHVLKFWMRESAVEGNSAWSQPTGAEKMAQTSIQIYETMRILDQELKEDVLSFVSLDQTTVHAYTVSGKLIW